MEDNKGAQGEDIMYICCICGSVIPQDDENKCFFLIKRGNKAAILTLHFDCVTTAIVENLILEGYTIKSLQPIELVTAPRLEL